MCSSFRRRPPSNNCWARRSILTAASDRHQISERDAGGWSGWSGGACPMIVRVGPLRKWTAPHDAVAARTRMPLGLEDVLWGGKKRAPGDTPMGEGAGMPLERMDVRRSYGGRALRHPEVGEGERMPME
mmetsp:Transcript_39473/g.77076  ORF Transcript_39473/g.77076 Transcript_39473/m.77076 type:complete len:129 (+) Transcript_39473:350-736(+)